VAALATQALVNPMYAVHAMPRLRAGEPPANVVAGLVAADPANAQRQFHIIDAQGRIGQHTGPDCVTWAGMVQGEDVSVAGNMLAGPAVVSATRDAYLAATGSLAERLLTAMEAGEAAGGDKRGRQAAGLKICTADAYPDLDIRADDHLDPLAELRRLYRVSLERYAVFRRFLAGRDSLWGELDRSVIEAAIATEGRPL
jgi:uncharacterized Ntn-hydrolase superfamily protein